LVDEHRTAGAARRRPALDAGGEHEVVEDELAASSEQIEQARLAVGAVEDIVLVDLDHGEPAALGGQRVSRPGGFLFLDEQAFARDPPLVRRHDRRKLHRFPPCAAPC
jgi:hypothetical protein